MRLRDLIWTTLLPLALILPAGCRSGGPCLVTETAGPYVLHDPGWAKEGEGTILRLENDRVSVEVVPALAGNVIRYVDKSRPADRQPFSRLDDAFANSGVWKAGEYTCRIGDRGPDKASLTVVGTGTLTPFGTAVEPVPPATPLRVERTLTVRRGSSAVHRWRSSASANICSKRRRFGNRRWRWCRGIARGVSSSRASASTTSRENAFSETFL